MSIVLINWIDGENDPFTLFNRRLSEQFDAVGRSTIILNLDSNFGKNLEHALQSEIEFAICWQGLGSNLKFNNSPQRTVWDEIHVPLVCFHGDHPCHMVANHSTDSDFVHHTYSAKSFAHYAEQYVPRSKPPQTINFFNLFHSHENCTSEYTGNFFVFPKNYDDTQASFGLWEQTYPEPIYDLMLEVTDAIQSTFSNGNSISHHEIIDRFLDPIFFDLLKDHFKIDDEYVLRHHVHSTLDKFYRNYISERVLLELHDVKIKIFGRGWERFKALGNKNHEFHSFDKAIDGDFQFQSNYGILDVAPIFDSLHDRTLRATAFNNGFLIASSWDHQGYLGQDFSDLFYSGRANELRERAERIVQQPDEHRHRAVEFGMKYNQIFSFSQFLNNVESLIRS